MEEYKNFNQDLLTRNKIKQYADPTSLSLSTAVLRLNPEHVTAWSFRRHCLLALRSGSADKELSFDKILQDELALTFASFQRSPKAYPIWEHRKWVLANIFEADWQAELKLLEKLLKLDGRNFHAWDYRRYVISRIKESGQSALTLDQDELYFSGQQIESNFSNFSAWHYRSKLLQSQLDRYDHNEGRAGKDARIREELEWVRGALWIDPNDQSAWLYHRWLLSQTQDEGIRSSEFRSIQELLEIEPDSKWAMTALLFYQPRKHQHYVDRLLTLDPLRKQRYLDLSNRLTSDS